MCVLSVGFRVFPSRGKINVNCRDLAQGKAVPLCLPMYGTREEPLRRPFSLGSSHCLTEYGCKG